MTIGLVREASTSPVKRTRLAAIRRRTRQRAHQRDQRVARSTGGAINGWRDQQVVW
ncbi:hypothetical protein AB0K18_40430 [Nonomuraea sp. NPDC049421]|uniref:hypothetical protein n=1 Tax=Nonomuraea sp. NPDC049421 TaxID=3155275 RepID=UPI003442C801